MTIKPNILICGKTGAGKTSLVRALTAEGVVPDAAIRDGEPCTEGFQVYETPAVAFVDSEGVVPGKTEIDEYIGRIEGEIARRKHTRDIGQLINCVWYCIDGSGSRVLAADGKIVERLGSKVLVLITKADLVRKQQMERMTEALGELLPSDRIIPVSSCENAGLKRLLDTTEAMVEKGLETSKVGLQTFHHEWETSFLEKSLFWQQAIDAEIESSINWAAGRAFAIAFFPLPLMDVIPLVANEMYLVFKIGTLHGVAVDKTVLAGFAACLGASVGGKFAASFLPLLKAPIAAAVTYAVGRAAKAYFASGMAISANQLRRIYQEAETKGKDIDWRTR